MRRVPSVSVSIVAVLLLGLPATRASAQGDEAAAAVQDGFAQAISSLDWREIGPVNMGGRVGAVAGVPGDPKTFWVGGVDGGVWKTTNGGTTFDGQWQDEESYSVGALAIAPSDHNVVWLGSGEGDPRNSVSYGLGVWRSTDGGDTWTHVGLRETERIHRIVVDPRDPDIALVCAMGREWGPNQERGVFKTTDAGATWTKVLYIDEDTGCSDLDIDLSNPRNMYAGMWTFRRRPWRFDDGGRETALYVSRDAGETWKKIETLPDEPMARIGLSVAQSSPNIVYLVTEFPTAGTLFRSEDHGETWTMVNDDRNLNFRPFYYSDVYVDPSNENVVYTLSGRLSKSTDGGRTFERIANDVHGDHQAFWIDPEDGNRLVSGSDGGYQVSYDAGENFHIFRNVALSQFYHVFLDDRDPYYVCGGLQDNGNWCGPSRTNEPDGILAGEWYTVSGGDGFYTVPVPGQPNLVYSNAQGGYFRITDTNSGMTRSIEPHPWMVGSQGQNMQQAKYRFNWDAPIHISPHDPSAVYWGGNVLFRSTDYGHSWEIISPDLSTNDPEKQRDSGGDIYNDNTAAEFHTTILSIAESPVEQGVIWAGTDDGNIQITRDGGATWMNVRDNVPGLPAETWIGNIEASPTEPGVAFVAVDNHRLDDFTPHVYETRDYGETWRDLSAGLPQDDYVKVVRQHPENASLLFVGMERGIYASFDRGETWVDIRNNLPRVSVRGIKIEPRYNDLVIGTHGRGAFILDDIQPLVELAHAVENDVHLIAMRTATDWEMWSRGSNLGQSTYRGENPEPGAYINYYLSEAAAGRVNATVTDEDAEEGNGANEDGEGSGVSSRTSPSTNSSSQRGEAARGESAERSSLNQGRGVTIRITDASGALVREISDTSAHAGINRAVWDLRWSDPSDDDEESEDSDWDDGGGGPTAVPGTYTATLVADGGELATTFELRGDPNVGASQADYEARFTAARRAQDLRIRLDDMLDATRDLTEQIDNMLSAIEGKEVPNAEAIQTTAEAAKDELERLVDETTRPPDAMNYRDWPRLVEQLRFVARGINGAQAKPTEGQLEVLTAIEQAADERAAELDGVVNGPIAELNALLEDQPQILSEWQARRVTTTPEDDG